MSEDAARPDLPSLLAYWQPIVRLADWNIVAGYERHLSRAGFCYPDWPYKTARIKIIEPGDWPGETPIDVEYQLLHELGHCHLAPFKTENGTPLGDAEEQIVTSYARALIAVRRGLPR